MNAPLHIVEPVPDRATSAPTSAARPAAQSTATVQPLGVVLLARQRADLLERAGFDDLARALGLPPDPALVRLDRGGFGPANSAGRAERGQVVLHPGHIGAGLTPTRALLAHELAHLAQARQRGPASAPALLLAELEARDIAARAAEGRMIGPVREALPRDSVLYDQSLSELVRARYAYEIARIRILLGRWIITDGTISRLFGLVEGLAMPVVQAIFSDLNAQEHETLIEQLSPRHFDRFRREILAAYSAIGSALIARQSEDLFEGMAFHGLSAEELVALGQIFAKGFPARAIAALRADPDQGPHVRAILDKGLIDRAAVDYDLAKERDKARDDLAARDKAQETAREDDDGRAAIAELQALLDKGDDASLVAALDLLGGFLNRPNLFLGIAEALRAPGSQERGPLDKLLDDFPERELTGRAAPGPGGGPAYRRIETILRLAEMRPPWKNIELAERLLSSAWIFNVLTSSEAFYAFQIVKVLPAAVREGFLSRDDGEYAGRIYDNLSPSMREGAGLNFYRGGEGRLDLANIQAQLLDDALWTPASIGRLQGLIRMAGAAGEAEWVFDRSRDVHDQNPAAYDDEDFRARVVAPFMLYDSVAPGGGRRFTWEPDYGAWAVENVWQMMGESFAGMGRAIALLTDSREGGAMLGSVMFGKSMGGEGISAVALQDLLGGSFMGIRFVSTEDRLDDPALAREVAAAREIQRGVNFIDRALWDANRGVIEVMANNLAIAAVRYPLGDLLISSGSGRLRQLDMSLSVATREDMSRPTNLDLRIGRLHLDDLLVVSRGSMITVNRVELSGLEIDLGRGAIADNLREAGRGFDPTSLFPLTPVLRLLDLAMGGTEDRVAEISQALAAPSVATPLMMTVHNLVLSGVQTSGGTYIDRLELDQARVGVAGNVDDYVAILFQSLLANNRHKARLERQVAALPPGEARIRLETRIAKIAARIGALRELRASIRAAQAIEAELGAQQNIASGARDRLAQARAVLAPFRQGGITFDAGRLRVAGMEGNVSLNDTELTDLHGRGESAPGLLAFLTDSQALGRIVEGQAHRPATSPGLAREEGRLTIELGDITGSTLRVAEGIPSIEDAQKALDKAKEALAKRDWDPALIRARDVAEQRLSDAVAYHQLAGIGVSYLSPDQVDRLLALRDRLTAGDALYIHLASARDATLGFDAGAGTVSLGAREFEATGPADEDGAAGAAIRMGGRSIRAASGTNVEISVGVSGGLSRFDDFAKRMIRAGVSAEALELQGLSDQASGTSIERIAGRGLDFDFDAEDVRDGRTGVLSAMADSLAAEGISSRVNREWLSGQIAAMQQKPVERRTAADEERMRGLQAALEVLDGFEQTLTELAAQIAAATDPAARAQLEAERDTAIALFRDWERKLGARRAELDNLNVEISGLGNLAANDFALDAALSGGVRIAGRGASGARRDRMFSRAALYDSRFGDAEAARIETGATFGRVSVSRDGIDLDDVYLEALTLEQFYLTSQSDAPASQGGGLVVAQIYSHGATTARGISLTGHIALVPMPEDPEQYRLASLRMDRLRIARLEAGDLGYSVPRNAPVPGAADPDGNSGAQGYSLDGGALLGVNGDGLTITMPEDARDPNASMRIRGTLTTAVQNATATAMIEGALTHGAARLNGERVSIEFVEDGGVIVDLGRRIEGADGRVRYDDALSVDQGRVETPWGESGFSGQISGRIRQTGAVTELEHIAMPSLHLAGLSLRAGNKSLSAAQPVDLTGIYVDATIDRSEPRNMRVTLTRLLVDNVAGQDLDIVWSRYRIHIRQDPALVLRERMHGRDAPPPLQISNLRIEDLDWSTQGGIAPGPGGETANIHADAVHGAFNLLRDDIGTNIDAIIDAGGLDFDFLRDGSQTLKIDDIDAELKGLAAAGVRVDLAIDSASTGLVSIADRTVTIPDLSLPLITLDELSIDAPRVKIEIPSHAGRITLIGTTAAAILDLAEEGSDAPFERLTIGMLEIPSLTARGVTLTVPDAIGKDRETKRDLIVSVPDSETLEMSGVRLEPAPGQLGFTITPDPTGAAGPVIEGGLHVDRATAGQLGFEIENALKLNSDVEATNFDLDFLSSGGVSLSLQELILTQLAAEAGQPVAGKWPHQLRLMTGESDHTANPRAVVTGINYSEDGEVSVGSAALRGLVYEHADMGVRLDIASAELPARDSGAAVQYDSDETLTIPRVIVTDATFDIADVMKLGGGGGSSTLENLNFLDALDGTIGLTLGIAPNAFKFADYAPGWVSERLLIRLDHGVFDLDQIDDEISAEQLIDFDMEGNRLVVNFDYGNLHPVAGMNPNWNTEILGFTLITRQEIEEGEDDKLRLSTAVQRLDSTGGGDPPVSFRDVAADLQLNETSLDLRDIGSIVLHGDSTSDDPDISVRGSLNPRGSGLPSELQIVLNRLEAWIDPAHPLTIGERQEQRVRQVQQGGLTIRDVHDTVLEFVGNVTPRRLHGTIGEAEIRDLKIGRSRP